MSRAAGGLGYADPGYRDSFRPFGEVLTLPESGLHLLKRPLPGDRFDLAGLYPYSSVPDWGGLAADLARLEDTGAVALSLVADPFQEDDARAAMAGWDAARPFKTHYVVDLSRDWRRTRSESVRRYARKARQLQAVFVAPDPAAHAADFWALYSAQAERQRMGPLQRMSAAIVAAQLRLPGAFVAIARTDEAPTGAMIGLAAGETAHLHLIGLASRAARLHTSYALIEAGLEHLEAQDCRLANLGGAVGLTNDPTDGVAAFKARWANARRTAWLGGRVLDRAAYERLLADTGGAGSDYFPAYRRPGSSLAWTPPAAG